MEKIRCLIIDDEELARKLLENFIGRLAHLEIAGMCKDPLEAMQVLREEPVDLMFLDIQMPELTGIEFLKALPNKPLVVFTTAYPEYALEGYQLDVVDYLLKPFSFERFVQAVNRAGEWLRLRAAQPLAVEKQPAGPAGPGKDYLLVKSEHRIHKLFYKDILYIESMREYVAYHTEEGRILSLYSLKKLEEELPPDRFMRIHKSYIIAIDRVRTLEGNRVHIGKEKLPVGASYREEVMRRVF